MMVGWGLSFDTKVLVGIQDGKNWYNLRTHKALSIYFHLKSS